MSQPLTLLQIGMSQEDAYSAINDNFNKVVQDVRDLGADLSTEGNYSVTVPASNVSTAVFTLTSLGVTSASANQVFTTRPASSVDGIAPQVDVYVDVDQDTDYLWPYGASLTTGQQSLFPIITPSLSGYADSLAAWTIIINNRDVSDHTYYVYTRCGYFPSGPTGFFR